MDYYARPSRRSPLGSGDQAKIKQTRKTAATSDHQRTRKPLFHRHSRPADTTHQAPGRLCKQEVAGSIPAGSTLEMPANRHVLGLAAATDKAEIKQRSMSSSPHHRELDRDGRCATLALQRPRSPLRPGAIDLTRLHMPLAAARTWPAARMLLCRLRTNPRMTRHASERCVAIGRTG
jgi:hypothetical protein